MTDKKPKRCKVCKYELHTIWFTTEYLGDTKAEIHFDTANNQMWSHCRGKEVKK